MGLNLAAKSLFKFALSKNKYDYLITCDADLQWDYHDIPKMVDLLIKNKNLNYIYGSRFIDKKRNPFKFRQLGSIFLSIAIWINTKKWLTDPTSSLRLYKKTLFSYFANSPNTIDELSSIWPIFCYPKTYYVFKTKHLKRKKGKSHFNNFFNPFFFMISELFLIIFCRKYFYLEYKKYIKKN